MRHSKSSDGSSSLPLALLGLTAGAWAVHAVARRSRRTDLRRKVVLVTGGSRGLGLVMARQLAAAGARVAICGRDPDTLQRAHEQLLQLSPDVLAFVADVTQAYDVRSLVSGITDQLGPIDIVINNVGYIQVGPAQLMTEDDYRLAMDEIFWSAFRVTEAVLPSMRKHGGGRIVNITSIGGVIPAPHLAPYVAAKHAMVGWSRAMHNELHRDGIKVTTVVPGLMRTGSPRNAAFKGNAEAEYAWFKLSDSLPPAAMSPERAAAAIINALVHGDAEITLTMAAKIGARMQALFPNFSASFGTVLNRMLPAPQGNGAARPGHAVETAVSDSPFATLTNRAAEKNNQMNA